MNAFFHPCVPSKDLRPVFRSVSQHGGAVCDVI